MLNFVKLSKHTPPISVDVEIVILMEVDSGLPYSLVTEKTLQEHWPGGTLSPRQMRLYSYTGDVYGKREVKASIKDFLLS